MSNEPTLAFTVHHKGRKYRAGMTAEEIGPAAGEIRAHAWVDGNAPAASAVPKQDAPDGGVNGATPPVPTPSALPTAGPTEIAAGPEAGSDADGEGHAKRGPGRGRAGGSGA